MTKNVWPLIVFTLLIQMAVGTLLMLASVFFIDALYLPEDVLDALSISLLVLIPPLLILSVLSAILHLSRPGNAKLALANLKKSWLSREMFLGIIFGLVSVTLCAIRLIAINPSSIFDILLWTGVLSGSLLLYGMSRIYMLRTVPAWNTWVTPISFFFTALLLGALILSIVLSFLLQTRSNAANNLIAVNGLLRFMGWGSASLLSAQLMVAFIKDRFLLWKGDVSRESILVLKESYPALGILRMIFGFLAIGLCILFALQPFSNKDFFLEIAIVLAFLLTLISESLGRFLFYASFKRNGL